MVCVLLTFSPFIGAVFLYIFGYCTTADFCVEYGYLFVFAIWFLFGTWMNKNIKVGLVIGGLFALFSYLVFACFLFEKLNPYWKYNVYSGRPPTLKEIEEILERREKIDLHKKIYVKSIIQVDKLKSLNEGEEYAKNEAKKIALRYKGKTQTDIRQFSILKQTNNLNKELMEFTVIISIVLK